MEPTRLERLAWAAGLFEGEGCITRRSEHSTELILGMTDEDVVRRFYEAVGCGSLSVESRKNGHKTLYRWRVGTTNEVRALLTAFLPWLGERRRQAAEDALALQLDNPGARALRTECPQGHPYDEANTYWYDKAGYPSRQCQTCRRERSRAQAQARKEARAALNATERAVWSAWGALREEEPSPVKQIAAQLGMQPADVAFIVYPADTFGRWEDDQEPDLI